MILNTYHTQRFTEGLEALRRQGSKSLATAKKADRLSKKDTMQGEKGRNGSIGLADCVGHL